MCVSNAYFANWWNNVIAQQWGGARLRLLHSVWQGNLTNCPPPICFKFTGVKDDGKEWNLRQN